MEFVQLLYVDQKKVVVTGYVCHFCRTAMWVQDLGRVNQSDIPNPISQEEREPFMMECDSPYGKLKHVAPVAKYSDTPSYYEKPVVPLGAHKPVW
ncbi:MAG TPA: hypothetical protein VI033_05780 [Candidatus Nitrosopolaris sp.]